MHLLSLRDRDQGHAIQVGNANWGRSSEALGYLLQYGLVEAYYGVGPGLKEGRSDFVDHLERVLECPQTRA